MQIKTTIVKECQADSTVTFTDAVYKKYKNKSLAGLAKHVKIDGFRAGKAPLEIVAEKISLEHLNETIVNDNFTEILQAILKESKLEPLSQSKVNITSNDPLELTVSFAIQPKVEIDNLKKIKFKLKPVKLSSKEVEAEIQAKFKHHQKTESVTRGAKKGDELIFNLEGFNSQKELVKGTELKSHSLVLGSNTMIPGFEDALEGVKAKTTKEFTITFPADYHEKSLQSQPVTFKAEILEVNQPLPVEITPELIKEATNEDLTVEEFTKKFQANLEHDLYHKEEHKLEDDMYATLLKNSKFEVCDILVQDEVEEMLKESDANIRKQFNIPLDEYLKLSKIDPSEFLDKFKKDGKERVKIKFIMQHLIKTEKLTPSDEDVKAYIEDLIKKADPSHAKQLESYYQKEATKNAVKNRLQYQNFLALFIEKDPKHQCN